MVDQNYTTRARRAFVVRLHSLSGVAPIGVFLIVHAGLLVAALRGRDAFEQAAAGSFRRPLLAAVELAGVALPLAFHAVYGLWLTARREPYRVAGAAPSGAADEVRASAPDAGSPASPVSSVSPVSSGGAALTLATFTGAAGRRVTGAAAFVFIAAHLWVFGEFWGAPWAHGWGSGARPAALYDALAARLSSTVAGAPAFAFAYLAGLSATVLHFASGLSPFCAAWGIATSDAARRRAGYASAAIGVLLFLAGADVVVFFATGSRAYFR